MKRRPPVDFHPGMIAAGLLCAFAAIILGALLTCSNEPRARAAAQLREDLRGQEAFAAESRR